MDEHVILKLKNNYAILILNREEKGNTFNWKTINEFDDKLKYIEKSDQIRGLIITGKGEKYFCTGADMDMIQSLNENEYSNFLLYGINFIKKMHSLSIPTICAINGLTIGGGGELAMACDIRIASKSARIKFPELKIGLVPGWGAAYKLTHLIGQAKAFEILITGKELDSQYANDIGLINKVVEDEVLISESNDFMQNILNCSPIAISLVKKIINNALETSLNEGYNNEMVSSLLTFLSTDGKEGINALMEKRKATWSK